ncbi:MAG: metal-dependent hydrolase [Desulforudis sp.]|nr:MAG: metal-dependent hydrolase [Desulforudis sp.]
MLYITHLPAGLMSGFVVLAATGTGLIHWPVGLLAAGLGSLAPDLDHGRSYLNQSLERTAENAGRKIPVVGTVAGGVGVFATRTVNRTFARVVKHRGPMHSPLTLAFVIVLLLQHWGMLAAVLGQPVTSGIQTIIESRGLVGLAWSCFFFGYISHLAADAVTDNGIRLWPFRFKLRLPLVKTGSVIERRVLAPGLWLAMLVTAGQAILNI